MFTKIVRKIAEIQRAVAGHCSGTGPSTGGHCY